MYDRAHNHIKGSNSQLKSIVFKSNC